MSKRLQELVQDPSVEITLQNCNPNGLILELERREIPLDMAVANLTKAVAARNNQNATVRVVEFQLSGYKDSSNNVEEQCVYASVTCLILGKKDQFIIAYPFDDSRQCVVIDEVSTGSASASNNSLRSSGIFKQNKRGPEQSSQLTRQSHLVYVEDNLLNRMCFLKLFAGFLAIHILEYQDVTPDDESIILQSFEKSHYARLQTEDSDVIMHVFQDGVDALEFLTLAAEKGLLISAIFADIQMPKMSGLDMARCLREVEAYQKVPIIAATADDITKSGFLDKAELSDKAEQSDKVEVPLFDAVLKKPFDANLLSLIIEALNLKPCIDQRGFVDSFIEQTGVASKSMKLSKD